MIWGRRHTGGLGWIDEFKRQIGWGINSLVEDTTPDTSADYLVTYDASTNLPKKVLFDNLDSDTAWYTITEVSASTDPLVVNTLYIDKSGTNSHVLPELSTLSEGDKIKLVIVASDRNVTIAEHANDSNAEIWTGVAIGDRVELMVVDTAWEIVEEIGPSLNIELALTADDSIPAASAETIFDAGYSEDADVGGYWDAVTNNRMDVPALGASSKLRLLIHMQKLADANDVTVYPTVGGAQILDVEGSSQGGNSTAGGFAWTYDAAASAQIAFEAYNDDTGGAHNVQGDAAKDETKVKITCLGRIRA